MELDNPDREEAQEAFGCTVKACSRCAEYLPADAEFFPRETRRRDGLSPMCKACWSEAAYKKRRNEREFDALHAVR